VFERLRQVRRGVQGFGDSAPEIFFFGPTYFRPLGIWMVEWRLFGGIEEIYSSKGFGLYY
jgi:hypothetical protein